MSTWTRRSFRVLRDEQTSANIAKLECEIVDLDPRATKIRLAKKGRGGKAQGEETSDEAFGAGQVSPEPTAHSGSRHGTSRKPTAEASIHSPVARRGVYFGTPR